MSPTSSCEASCLHLPGPQLSPLHAESLPGSSPPCALVWRPRVIRAACGAPHTHFLLLGVTVLRCLMSRVLKTLDPWVFSVGWGVGRSSQVVVPVWPLSLHRESGSPVQWLRAVSTSTSRFWRRIHYCHYFNAQIVPDLASVTFRDVLIL